MRREHGVLAFVPTEEVQEYALQVWIVSNAIYSREYGHVNTPTFECTYAYITTMYSWDKYQRPICFWGVGGEGSLRAQARAALV